MSTNGCCVPGCKNKRIQKSRRDKVDPEKLLIQFYRFPSRPWLKERREIWIKFVKRTHTDGSPWTPTIHSLICSQHFVSGVKSEDPRHPGYNPTIFDPKKQPTEDPKVLMARYHRVVARSNRQKEESRALQDSEKVKCSTGKVGADHGVVITLSPSPQTYDEDEGSDDAPESRMLENSETDDASEDYDEVLTEDITGPKQLLCLICCDYCSPECYRAYCNNVNFMRLCKLLYPSVPEGNMFLKSLKSLDYLSICTNCQSLADSVAIKKVGVLKVSARVRELQLLLLKELKVLQERLGEFQGEMKRIRSSVRISNESLLRSYLKSEDNICSSAESEKSSHTAIINFRKKLIQKVDNLEVFGREIQKKVDCSTDESTKSTVNHSSAIKIEKESSLGLIRSSEVIDLTPESPSIQGDVDASYDDPLSTSAQPVSTLVTRSENVKTSELPCKRLLKLPVVLGKTIRKGSGTRIIVKHVWDGINMKTVAPPRPPPKAIPCTYRPSNILPRKRVECPACKKRISYNYLPSHRRYSCPITTAALPPPQFMCHLCSKTFRLQTWLDIHMKSVHCEDRPFLCAQCPKACKTMQSLKAHEESHCEERPFVCRNGCGGGFKKDKSRRRHESMCNGKGTPFRKKAKQVVPPTPMEQGYPVITCDDEEGDTAITA